MQGLSARAGDLALDFATVPRVLWLQRTIFLDIKLEIDNSPVDRTSSPLCDDNALLNLLDAISVMI